MIQMNLSRYLLSVGIGAILFLGVIFSEFEQYRIYQLSTNPLENTQVFSGVKTTTNNQFPEKYLTQNGDLFVFFQNSNIDFGQEHPELKRGAVYIDSLYHIDKQQFDIILSVENTNIHSKGAKLYVEQDSERQHTIVYAIDNAITLSWDGNKDFIVPAGFKVSIPQNYTGATSSHNNKSNLQPQTYEVQNGEFKNPNIAEQRIGLAYKQSQKYAKQMENFAYYLPLTWETIPNKSFLGAISQYIKSLQSQVGLGIPEKKIVENTFEILANDLVQGHKYIEKNRATQAQLSLDSFGEIYESPRWNSFINKHPAIINSWKVFEIAHKNSFQNIPLGDPRKPLQNFWEQQNNSTIDTIYNKLHSAEKQAFDKQFFQSQQYISALPNSIKELTPSTDWVEIRKMRNIFAGILERHPILQTQPNFEIYTSLITLELQGSSELVTQREIFHELLVFLGIHIENPEDILSTRILLESYKVINPTTLIKEFGNSEFVQSEKEIISFIKKVGGSGLTKEDIERIRAQRKQIKVIEEQINELRGDNEVVLSGIQTSNQLEEFLLKASVKVYPDLITVIQDDETKYIAFKNLRYQEIELSGLFNTTSQGFESLQIGDVTQDFLSQQHFSLFLKTTVAQIKKGITPTENPIQTPTVNQSDVVPQRTAGAILEKRLIREIFIAQGFANVSSENIKILNRDFTIFEIKDMTALPGHRVKVKYDKGAKLVYDINLTSGSISNIKLINSYPIDKAFEWIKYEERKVFDSQFDPEIDLPPYTEPKEEIIEKSEEIIQPQN